MNIVSLPHRNNIIESAAGAQDLGERLKTKEILRRTIAKYEALALSDRVVVWEADPSTFQRRFVSHQTQQIFGYTAERWLSDPELWQDAIYPEDRGWVIGFCTQAAKEIKNYELEYRMLAADGRIVWVRDMVWVAAEGGRPKALSGLTQDVTERKLVERTHQIAHQSGQSRPMEAAERLASASANGLNTLLTVINGYGELILTRSDTPHPLRKDILEICKAGARAAALTRPLPASKPKVVQPKMLNLNSVIYDMEKVLRQLIGKNTQLFLNLTPGLGRVKSTRKQIELVILSIALNARDAMPDGGVLIIETENEFVDEAYSSRDSSAPPGAYVVLAILDSGRGMDKETMSRLFDHAPDSNGSSGGLLRGLSAVHGIIERHGGHIDVSSAPGRGSTFKIYFPMARGEKRMLREMLDAQSITEKLLYWHKPGN